MKHLDKSIQNKPGVYMITCKVNGKRYIGSSKNVRTRISAHRSKSSCIALRSDIKKYGFFDAFEITILTYCGEEERFTLEYFAIQSLLPEYNINKGKRKNWYERHKTQQYAYCKRSNYAAAKKYLTQKTLYEGKVRQLASLRVYFKAHGVDPKLAKNYLLQ